MNNPNITPGTLVTSSGFAQIDPNAFRPATAEDIALSKKSKGDLVLGAQSKLDMSVQKALGRYGKVQFAKFTPTKVFECRQLLESGEDPFMLALYFNVDFGAIAKLANNVLKVKCEAEGWKVVQIPETLLGYLKLQESRLAAGEAAEKLKQEQNQAAIAPVVE